MMVADINKNMEGYILNLFMIACFNLRLIIFFLVKNTTKPNDYINCIIRLMLEQVEGNSYY